MSHVARTVFVSNDVAFLCFILSLVIEASLLVQLSSPRGEQEVESVFEGLVQPGQVAECSLQAVHLGVQRLQ